MNQYCLGFQLYYYLDEDGNDDSFSANKPAASAIFSYDLAARQLDAPRPQLARPTSDRRPNHGWAELGALLLYEGGIGHPIAGRG
jgi:hypothetical protein